MEHGPLASSSTVGVSHVDVGSRWMESASPSVVASSCGRAGGARPVVAWRARPRQLPESRAAESVRWGHMPPAFAWPKQDGRLDREFVQADRGVAPLNRGRRQARSCAFCSQPPTDGRTAGCRGAAWSAMPGASHRAGSRVCGAAMQRAIRYDAM
jgi:hypothetical protein